VKTYEVVLSMWAAGDFSEHLAFTDYPRDIDSYARRKFNQVKARQLDLLPKS
jgi:hypothetical protein